MSGATFRGTVAEFHKFLGPRYRNVVQQLTKAHKAKVGQCQRCGSAEGPFDAAHLHGRSRPELIHQILGSDQPLDVIEIDVTEFEAAFRFEHTPIEKSILVLCKSCHQQYDAPPAAAAPAPGPGASEPVLPITLEPRGVDAFRDALLATRKAVIRIEYADGHTAEKVWNAAKVTPSSNILGNLRSRPDLRAGAWQRAGIVAVRVAVAPGESGAVSRLRGSSRPGVHRGRRTTG